MNEKNFSVFVLCFITIALFPGCATKPARLEPIDYIKPATVEAAQYGIDERSQQLERTIADCRSEIGNLRESCEAIIDAGGRSGNLIQDTIEKAQSLDRWVRWAYSRLQYLESVLASQVQD